MNDIVERQCDRCGQPEYRHVAIVGLGKVCPVSAMAFSTSKTATIECLQAEVERLEAELAPLRKLRDAPEWETIRQALAAKGETR